MKKEWQKLEPVAFPPLLREIPDTPKELWVEGTLPRWDEVRVLTVVGSRKYSQYGKDVCEKLIAGLAGYPIVIVSGLAIGIDTIAHKAALSARLPTIAVPGSGLDRSVLHPRSNARLADEIVAAGGALISEQKPLAPAGLHTFPRRNRIMAGLSHAVLIIEAGEQSGTLITARLALDYNRDVLAVPGSIFLPGTAGTNRLISEGATLIHTSETLIRALGLIPLMEGVRERPTLNTQELLVYKILEHEALERDVLLSRLPLLTAEANVLIATLEMKGIIVERGGEIQLA